MIQYGIRNFHLPVKVLTRSKQPQDVLSQISCSLHDIPETFNEEKQNELLIVTSRFAHQVVTEESIEKHIDSLRELHPDRDKKIDFDIDFGWPVPRAILNFEIIAVPQVYNCSFITTHDTVTHLKQLLTIPIIVDMGFPRRANICITTVVREFLPFEFYIVEVERLAVSNVFPVLQSGMVLDRQPRKSLQRIVREIVESMKRVPQIGSYTVSAAVENVYGIHDIVWEEAS